MRKIPINMWLVALNPDHNPESSLVCASSSKSTLIYIK